MSLSAEQVLKDADALVVKIGGDTAGRFQDVREMPDTLEDLQGREVPKVFVVSAVRSSAAEHARFAVGEGMGKGFNTTTHLNAMADALKEGRGAEAEDCLKAVHDFTKAVIDQRVEGVLIKALRTKLEEMIWKLGYDVREAAEAGYVGREARFLRVGEDRIFGAKDGGIRSFTGFGEQLAEELLAKNFFGASIGVQRLGIGEREGLNSFYFDEFGRLDLENAEKRTEAFLKEQLAGTLDSWVTGGAFPGMMKSRGYSDVAAVAAMNAMNRPNGALVVGKESPIWSVDPVDFPGEGALVSGLTRSTSTELFGPHGLDAGALHPDAVKDLHHPAVVFNPRRLELGMTLISDDCEVREGVLVVGRKPIPAVVRVSSPDMVDRHGVFQKVMDSLQGAVVSHTYTSEARIIVTVNGKVENLTGRELEARLQGEFDASYTVRVTPNGHSMVFALGNALEGAREVGLACTALHNAGIKVAFQDLVTEAGVMKFVVASDDAKRAVGVLHEVLVKDRATLSA